jgi:hypothetical protein
MQLARINSAIRCGIRDFSVRSEFSLTEDGSASRAQGGR